MTDKQIIIDNVDVSGCEHFRKDDPCKNTCHYFCTPCEWVQIQNCMYKYGKRKEQECEELNKTITNLENIRDEFSTKLDQLKAENEELKEKNRQLTILGMDLNQSNEVLRKSFFATDKSRDYWREQAEKLSKTLTEIREIAEDFGFNGTYESYKTAIDQILQKISECEVEDE